MNLRKRQNHGVGQLGSSLDRAGAGVGRHGVARVGGGVVYDHHGVPSHHLDQQDSQHQSRYRYNSSSIPYLQKGFGTMG